MDPLRWQRLTPEQLTQIYLNELCRDFPPSERKPLSMVLAAEAGGTAHSWGVYTGSGLVAYLLMVRPAGSPVSLLDYFAVLPAYRAGGLGAQLLAALPEKEEGTRAILIESEIPEKSPDPALAQRRLGFYARAGAAATGWSEHLFDAWFHILALPCPGQEPLPAGEAVARLIECYRQSIPAGQWKKYVQFFRPDGSVLE